MPANTSITTLTANNTINDMRLKVNELVLEMNEYTVKFATSNTSMDAGNVLISNGVAFTTEPKEYLSDGGNF